MNQTNNHTSYEKVNTISIVATAVAAVLTLIIFWLINLSALPQWFIIVPIAFLLTVLIIPLKNWWTKYRLRRLEEALARTNFPTLITLSKQFSDLTSLRKNDTVVFALGNIQKSEMNLQNRELADLVEWMTGNLITRLENCHRGFTEFKSGVQDLHALTHSFHRTYFFESIKKLRSIDSSKVAEDDKKTIEVSRESFTRYLERFQTHCIETNEKLNRKEFDYHFEKARPL